MFFKRRKKIANTNQGSNTGQMMNLALFIMLLAFFIVLNSMSSYEEIKTESVKRSIKVAFTNEEPEAKPSVQEDPTLSMREGHTFDRLDALFQAQIVSFEAQKSKSSGRMMIRVEKEKFLNAVMQEGQFDLYRYPTRRDVQGNFFLPTLVSIIRSNIDGAPTRLEIIMNSDENPAQLKNANPQELRQNVRQVGSVAQKLESQGLSQKLLTIGLTKGDTEFVDLIFTKYVPFSPTVDDEVMIGG